MATLYVLVGLPGSGKSWFADHNTSLGKTIKVSSDEIRECLYGDESIQGNPNIVFAWMEDIVRECLLDGRDVIYDATSLTKVLRRNIIKTFKDTADEIICIYFNVSLDLCMKRNRARSRHVPDGKVIEMAERFEKPSSDEPFSRFFRYDGRGGLSKMNIKSKTPVLL